VKFLVVNDDDLAQIEVCGCDLDKWGELELKTETGRKTS
jgi:hypothetical protein